MKTIEKISDEISCVIGNYIWDYIKSFRFIVSEDKESTIVLFCANKRDSKIIDNLLTAVREYNIGSLIYELQKNVYLKLNEYGEGDNIEISFGKLCEETNEIIEPDYVLGKEFIKVNNLKVQGVTVPSIRDKNCEEFL